jgi:hypothetical protein
MSKDQAQEQEEGLPKAAEVGINYENGDVRLHSIVKGLLSEGDELVRRKGIVEKLESSIRASLKFRDRFTQGTDSWHRYNHAAQEKLAILRYVVNKPREQLEKEDPKKLLEELLEEVKASE